jgi:hypothetical protein
MQGKKEALHKKQEFSKNMVKPEGNPMIKEKYPANRT